MEHLNKDGRMCTTLDVIDSAADKAVPFLRQLTNEPPDRRSYFVKYTLREWEAGHDRPATQN